MAFANAGYLCTGFDILGNIVEIANDEVGSVDMWEDVGQIALAVVISVPSIGLGAPAIAAGTVILFAWELWEYERSH